MWYNKIKFAVWLLLLLSISCYVVPQEIDAMKKCQESEGRLCKSATTRSAYVIADDSLTMICNVQGDLNNLMLGRIIKQDEVYVLSIKREDAIFLGVSNELYDIYVDYVGRLNNRETNGL